MTLEPESPPYNRMQRRLPGQESRPRRSPEGRGRVRDVRKAEETPLSRHYESRNDEGLQVDVLDMVQKPSREVVPP
jgi:hypothetical protein